MKVAEGLGPWTVTASPSAGVAVKIHCRQAGGFAQQACKERNR